MAKMTDVALALPVMGSAADAHDPAEQVVAAGQPRSDERSDQRHARALPLVTDIECPAARDLEPPQLEVRRRHAPHVGDQRFAPVDRAAAPFEHRRQRYYPLYCRVKKESGKRRTRGKGAAPTLLLHRR